MTDPCVTATVQIDARPDVVYELITDLPILASLAEEAVAMRWHIVASDSGCRVTESTWDRRPRWFRTLAGKATGVTDRVAANTEHIQLTLQRLKQRAEAR